MKKLSKWEVEFINNIVDNELSEFYVINKRYRHFWHARSVTISCRVRDKNSFNTAPEIAQNIRAYLLGEDDQFLKEVSETADRVQTSDMKQLEQFAISFARKQGMDEQEAKKNIGLIIMGIPKEELKGALALENVVSCRLLGYEKEFFYLKCYSVGMLPVYIMRVLYHTKYDHRAQSQIQWEEYYQELEEKIDFNEYVERIKFE